MRERLKQLRRELAITQAAFAEKIGLKQGSYADIERGKNKLNARNRDAICREFNINSAWLETGEGEMFREVELPAKSYLDLLAEEKGLSGREKALIGSIIDLPPSARNAVIDWALALARSIDSDETPEEKELREIQEQRRRLDEREQQLTGGNRFSVEDTFSETG